MFPTLTPPHPYSHAYTFSQEYEALPTTRQQKGKEIFTGLK